MFRPLFRPPLSIDTSLPYRPIFPEADQLSSPTQIDGGLRDMRVNIEYSHPIELAADPANLAGFAFSAGSPVSPVSFQIASAYLDLPPEDIAFQETLPLPLPDPVFNPSLTDISGFESEFFFHFPSELTSARTRGVFPSEEMEGLRRNPFMGATQGSVFDEDFPISCPPVPKFIDTELPPLNFSFLPEIDMENAPPLPWDDASSFLQQPELPSEDKLDFDPARAPNTWGESDIEDGPGWPSFEDFEKYFPTLSSSHGDDSPARVPSLTRKQRAKAKHMEKRFAEGALRQQAVFKPRSQVSLDRLERYRVQNRLIREEKAEQAKEQMALHHASRRAPAQANLPSLVSPRSPPHHFVPLSPRGPPPALPPRTQAWQFGPLKHDDPQANTHRPVPRDKWQTMPKASPWKVGFRVPAHNDTGVVWYQVLSADGDVLGYQPRHEQPVPSFGGVLNPPAAIPRQMPPHQGGPVLLVPRVRFPAGTSSKRKAGPSSKGNPKKIVLIDGIAYQRL